VIRAGCRLHLMDTRVLVPSVGFMLVIERFLKSDVLAKVGS
jgi:hypothetical protein